MYVSQMASWRHRGRVAVCAFALVATATPAAEAGTGEPRPSTPRGLRCESGESVELTWRLPGAQAEQFRFNIYEVQGDQAIELQSQVQLTVDAAGEATHTIDGRAGETRSYFVKTVSSSGQESWRSNIQACDFVDGDTERPTRGFLNGTSHDPYSFLLTWRRYSDNVGIVGYEIYSETLAGDRSLLVELGPDATEFLHTGLLADTVYLYRVFAVDAAGNRSYSGLRGGITKHAASDYPTPPTGMTVEATGPGEVSVSWEASQDDEGIESYHVVYRDSQPWPRTHSAKTTETSIVISGLEIGMTYHFYVRAYDIDYLLGWRNGIKSVTVAGPSVFEDR